MLHVITMLRVITQDRQPVTVLGFADLAACESSGQKLLRRLRLQRWLAIFAISGGVADQGDDSGDQ